MPLSSCGTIHRKVTLDLFVFCKVKLELSKYVVRTYECI